MNNDISNNATVNTARNRISKHQSKGILLTFSDEKIAVNQYLARFEQRPIVISDLSASSTIYNAIAKSFLTVGADRVRVAVSPSIDGRIFVELLDLAAARNAEIIFIGEEGERIASITKDDYGSIQKTQAIIDAMRGKFRQENLSFWHDITLTVASGRDSAPAALQKMPGWFKRLHAIHAPFAIVAANNVAEWLDSLAPRRKRELQRIRHVDSHVSGLLKIDKHNFFRSPADFSNAWGELQDQKTLTVFLSGLGQGKSTATRTGPVRWSQENRMPSLIAQHIRSLTSAAAEEVVREKMGALTSEEFKKSKIDGVSSGLTHSLCINSAWRYTESGVSMREEITGRAAGEMAHKLAELLDSYGAWGCIVLDEVTQVLESLTSELVQDAREACIEAIKEIINKAQHVLIADADLYHKPSYIQHLKTLFGIDFSDRVVSVVGGEADRSECKMTLTHNIDACAYEIQDAIASRKKIIIGTSSRQQAITLHLYCKTLCQLGGWAAKIGLVHGDEMKTYAELRDEKLIMCDPSRQMATCDIFIFSPVITAGVSCTINWFEKGFFFYRSGGIGPTDLLQMCHRARPLRDITLCIDPSAYARSGASKLDAALIRRSGHRDEASRALEDIKIHMIREQMHAMERFCTALLTTGYDIRWLEKPRGVALIDFEALRKQAREQRVGDKIQAVCKCRDGLFENLSEKIREVEATGKRPMNEYERTEYMHQYYKNQLIKSSEAKMERSLDEFEFGTMRRCSLAAALGVMAHSSEITDELIEQEIRNNLSIKINTFFLGMAYYRENQRLITAINRRNELDGHRWDFSNPRRGEKGRLLAEFFRHFLERIKTGTLDANYATSVLIKMEKEHGSDCLVFFGIDIRDATPATSIRKIQALFRKCNIEIRALRRPKSDGEGSRQRLYGIPADQMHVLEMLMMSYQRRAGQIADEMETENEALGGQNIMGRGGIYSAHDTLSIKPERMVAAPPIT